MNENLCMGCMQDKGEETTCPHCGYSVETPHIPSYLSPRVIIGNRYIIGKVLSYNGESVIYIGYDTISQKRVNIQEYFPDTLVNRSEDGMTVEVKNGCQIQFKAYMSDYVEVVQKLSHMRTLTCVVQVLGIEHQNETVYAIKEHINGVTLQEYLDKRGVMLTWTEASDLIVPIMKTLSLIHQDGLIHRGISTTTLLLSKNKIVKLDGFAISAVRAARTELVAELFPGFSAPEQYSTISPHGPWTDVYAVCALLYSCVTGQAPPEALIRSALKELTAPRERNETVPPRVSQAILQGLSLNPEERIQAMDALVARIGGPFQSEGQPQERSANRSNSASPAIRNIPPKPSIPSATRTLPRQQPPAHPGRNEERGKKRGEGGGKDVEKQETRRLIFWSMGITLPILLLILIFTFWYLFGSSARKTEKRSDTTSISSSSDLSSGSSNFVSSVPGLSSTPSSASDSSSSSSSSTDAVTMKNLVGKKYETVIADAELKALYKFSDPQYVYDETVEKGVIISQNIAVNEVVAPNAKVLLTVSKGSKFITLPPYEKVLQDDYAALLDKLGVKYIFSFRSSSNYPEGYVVGTSLGDNGKYDIEKAPAIEVYISKSATPPAVSYS